MEDYFLKIDGIQGESQDAKHKGEIELVSFSWGLTNPAAGTGGGAGRARFEDFHFAMLVNKASPQLFLACASGKHIKEANLSVRRTSGKDQLEYLKIKFTDLLITSFDEAAAEHATPQETVAFNFAQIGMDYSPPGTTGTTGAEINVGWDLSKNQKI